MKTGISDLDRLLSGGLYTGEVTEFCGPSRSGKTRACVRVAAATARVGKDVLFLDASSGIVTLAHGLAASLSPGSFDGDEEKEKELNQSNLKPILEKIQLMHVSDCFSLIEILAQIRSLLREKQSLLDNHNNNDKNSNNDNNSNNNACFPPKFQPSLIVIDSLASIVSPLLGGREIHHGLSYLASIGRELKLLASDFNLAVLVTNHVVTSAPSKIESEAGESVGVSPSQPIDRPAMGLAWLSCPHVRVKFVIARESSSQSETFLGSMKRKREEENEDGSQGLKVFAVLTKHSRIPCGKTKLITI